ncbi:MAG TPA: hypothetical protein VJB38_12945 [Bacteroidota bacterium]|nr:hypothetical protein [Bacteroidota bacterium]
MFEEFKELYVDSGMWAQPILISTLLLFVAGSVMMFTVRLIKRFVFYSLIALLLPNSIGFVGYLEEADSIQEAIVERGTELTEEVEESMEDLKFSPVYLGMAGSALTVLLGLAGIAKVRLKRRENGNPDSNSKITKQGAQ